jgi:molecular chaperone GrpE
MAEVTTMADEQKMKKEEPAKPAPDEAAKAEGASKPAEEPVDVEALKVKACERDEFLALLKVTAADFSNYRKRVERDRVEWTERAVGEFVQKLLTVLDDFDRAVDAAEKAPDAKTMLQGFRQIEQKLYGILKEAGIEPFEPHGEAFDPGEHHAVIVEETDALPHDHVSEVVQKGYRLKDRVIRPALVKVSKRTTKDKSAGKEAPAEGKPEDPGQ